MDIGNRILELLYFKDCVIIPGLGGFVSHYVPARIREESQTFVPPAKEIGFNRELIQDDGLLSDYLAKSENITISVARTLIDEFVNSFMQRLADEGQIHLTSIGKFRYAKTGELIFSANKETNFLPDSYGLSSFHFIRPVSKKENPLLRSAIFKQDEKVKVITLPGLTKPERDKSLRRVALALPLLLAISLLPINSRNGQHTANVIPLSSLSVLEMPVNGNTSRTAVVLTEPEQDDEIEQTHINRESYAIIAGSFSLEKNALILKQDLSDKGYNPEVWKATNGFFRVVLQAQDNMQKAQQAVANLKEELPGIECWILQ